jgi:hypothetical protein
MTTRHNPGDTVHLIHASKWAPRRMVTRKIVKITDAGYTLDKGARVSLDGCNRRSGFEGWATAEQVAEQKAAAELHRLRRIATRAVSHADAATLHRVLEVLGIHHTAV